MNNVKEEKQHKNEKRRRNNKRRKDTAKKDNSVSASSARIPEAEYLPPYAPEPVQCSLCNKPVKDFMSALADKTTGEPVHFDCVLNYLNEHENLEKNRSISYIGQGRFAVISFKTPSDLSHFTIERIIEWEPRDKKYSWRSDIADLYSSIK
ncbi:hypothetical protein H0R92_08275 [Treponema sp. OMZ 840]|uniref:hypothetical protein n=1 Tax=Treponema sp. OMZ 840 TaxID=244313 RepID=UPI003D90079A